MRHVDTGRPLGDEKFVEEIERITGKMVKGSVSGILLYQVGV